MRASWRRLTARMPGMRLTAMYSRNPAPAPHGQYQERGAQPSTRPMLLSSSSVISPSGSTTYA
eukprot:1440696-Rhodomonas_salina.1